MLTPDEMRALPLDSDMVDAALMTTRGVRRRLDLDRPVPDQVLLDCIDVAEQAPTGGNEGSRRWVIVTDQRVKDQIAEIYLSAGADWVIERATAIEGTDHPNANMMQGAKYLAQNIQNVPALVIPTILGVHDGSGRPGLFDSIIQSGWSFQVALRARGLGSVWTTMILGETAALREILGIPDDVTPVALFPVAYTKGTEFSPSARRYPAKQITYWNKYARTFDEERGDGSEISGGPGTVVEIDIKASPSRVWELVTDVDLPGRFSEEYQGGGWTTDEEPTVGSTFVGRNKHPNIGEWETTSHVAVWDPPRTFRWHVSDLVDSAAQWEFHIERVPGGSRLRFRSRLGPGNSGLTPALESMPEKAARIIAFRQDEHRANMQRVIEGVKELAESTNA